LRTAPDAGKHDQDRGSGCGHKYDTDIISPQD
jgi:hypothetical protein